MRKIILGDIHNQKATTLLKDEKSCWIYKPRNAKTEVAFKTFLLNLEREGLSFFPGVVEILQENENEHTQKVIEQLPAMSIEEVQLFYKRCGGFLCIAYLFSSKDLHCENIIANGSYPILVDYETLLSGEIDRTSDEIKHSVVYSVLSSHLLPCWSVKNGKAIDCGGLSGENKNILFFDNKRTYIYEYIDAVVEGFKHTYNFILMNKELVEENLQLFNNCEFRVLLRPTQLYMKIIEFIDKQTVIDKKSAAKLLLERAYSNDIDTERRNKTSAVLEAEIKSVVAGEIPLFWTHATKCGLYGYDGLLQNNFLKRSPIESAIQKLTEFSESDCTDQINIITQTLQYIKPLNTQQQNACRSEFVIKDIFDMIEGACIYGLSSHWIMLEKGMTNSLFIIDVGYGLYDGLIGILCMYAAIYNKTRNENYLSKLLYHYNAYRKYALLNEINISDSVSGIQMGAGGHILSLSHISMLTGEDLFLSDAKRLLDAIVLPYNLEEGNCDVMTGYAGLAIALPYVNSAKAKKIALLIGKKLINWTPTLTGVAHGAAGVSLALGALGSVLDTNEFDEKILQLLHWENAQYDERENNWYDLRTGTKGNYMFGWCSGAPGIGMARKRLSSYSANERIKQLCESDINKVKQEVTRHKLLRRDSLCCGNCAVLMSASMLGVKLDSVYHAIVKKVKDGEISLYHPANTCDFNAGLMQGYSGIGYTLAMYGNENCGGMLL